LFDWTINFEILLSMDLFLSDGTRFKREVNVDDEFVDGVDGGSSATRYTNVGE